MEASAMMKELAVASSQERLDLLQTVS